MTLTQKPRWTFLTNHGHVLLAISRDPDARVRDIAEKVGITERAVQAIIGDLEDGGFLKRVKVGRRNTYAVSDDAPMRHPVSGGHSIGQVLNVLAPLDCSEG